MTTCINLDERYGRRYRIGWEADGATKGQTPRDEWPWLMEIRGRSGTVSPFGGDVLQAYSDRPRVARALRRLPGLLHARGDDEVIVRFPVEMVDAVFALIRPSRRRQVSDAEKARLTAMGERFRFGGDAGVQSDFPGAGATIGAPDRGEGAE